jgi:peptide deformylase
MLRVEQPEADLYNPDMELVYYPDPRLRDVSKKISTIDQDILDAVPQMFEIMYKARGIGLAGPQAGLGRRIVVANLTGDPKKKDEEQVFINPEILDRAGKLLEEEGCLSLPGMGAQIQRAEKVLVRYKDLKGKMIEREAEQLESRLFQHEIDHLDGILIVDKMTPADRKQWAPLIKELEEDFKANRKPKRRPPPRPTEDKESA